MAENAWPYSSGFGSGWDFSRHREAMRSIELPGDRLQFRLGSDHVGYVRPEFAELLVRLGCKADGSAVSWPDPDSLQDLARRASEAVPFRWRDEAFDVRAAPDGEVLAEIDRGALPSFGIMAEGVHANGLVQLADGLHLWVGYRSPHKALDPGKLDHLVAGGIPAGMTPMQTLIKEAGEEAGLSEALAGQAIHRNVIGYAVERPEGLRRDRLHCYDLMLPEDFVPAPHDDEVERFELWPLARVAERVRDTDDFKFNVNLVLIDLFARLGWP